MAYGLATEDDDAQALNKEVEITKEDAEKYTFTFGKYKGMTIKEVLEDECDDGYIEWLLNNSKDERIIKMIELITGEVKPTEEEQQERLDLLVKFEKLIIATKTNREKLYEYYGVENNTQMTNEQFKDAITVMENKQ